MPKPHINACEIVVPKDATIPIRHWPYTTDEQFREDQAAHRDSWILRRFKSTVEAIRLQDDGWDPGGDLEHRPYHKEPHWLARLVKYAILTRYRGKAEIHSLGPDLLVGTRDDNADHPLGPAQQAEFGLPSWMAWRVAVAYSTRVLYPEGQLPRVLLTCDVRGRITLDATWAQLRDQGLDELRGYVQALRPDPWPALTRPRHTIGRPIRAESDWLVLDDHRPGWERVQVDQCWQEPRREHLERFIQRLRGAKAQSIWDESTHRAALLTQGERRRGLLCTALTMFADSGLLLLPDLRIRPHILGRQDKRSPSFEVFDPPQLFFEPGGARTAIWAAQGLDEHGPYDQQVFSRQSPRIAVICEARHQGKVEGFISHLLDGMPELRDKGGRPVFAKGMRRRFHLKNDTPKPTLFTSANASVEAYREASRKALKTATEQGWQWDLVMVQVHGGRGQNELPPDMNPYHVTKAMFFKRNIPTQEFTGEKLNTPALSRAHILNNISLACYAKLGGTPWLLPADRTVAHEIILGLGNYEVKKGRMGAPERSVGLCAVFDRFGEYLLDTRTELVPYERYAEALLSRLRDAVKQVRAEQGWKPDDAVRLIFHAFKPLKNKEVEAVRALMKELNLPHAQHAFLHLEQSHPYLILETENRDKSRGAWAPHRGCWTQLDRNSGLLALKGPGQLKRETDGVPNPLLLTLHKQSNFTDLGYLARQVFHFACNSLRTVSPSTLPVSVLYPQLMAGLLRPLRDLKDWDQDAGLAPIGRSRWFL